MVKANDNVPPDGPMAQYVLSPDQYPKGPPKTPEELARAYKLIRFARNFPCSCKGPCVPACVAGGRMMDAQLDVFLWALGYDLGPTNPINRVIADVERETFL